MSSSSAARHVCGQCGGEGKARCSGCRRVWYCGVEHQRLHRKVHAPTCFIPANVKPQTKDINPTTKTMRKPTSKHESADPADMAKAMKARSAMALLSVAPSHARVDVAAKCALYVLMEARSQLLPLFDHVGSKKDWLAVIARMEEIASSADQDVVRERPLTFRALLINSYRSPIYEFPTDELCRCLLALFRHFGCARVLELAAGCGLLTARLQRFQTLHPHPTSLPSKSMHSASSATVPIPKPQEASATAEDSPATSKPNETSDGAAIECVASDPDEKQLAGKKWSPVSYYRYTDVVAQSFDTINEPGTAVLVSWLPQDSEPEFLGMLERNKPSIVCLVGEPCPKSAFSAKASATEKLINGATYTPKLIAWATKHKYGVYHVPAKQLCFRDMVGASLQKLSELETDSRSTVLFLVSPNVAVSVSDTDIASICGAENLGTCRIRQDMELLRKLVINDFELELKHDTFNICSYESCKPIYRTALQLLANDKKNDDKKNT